MIADRVLTHQKVEDIADFLHFSFVKLRVGASFAAYAGKLPVLNVENLGEHAASGVNFAQLMLVVSAFRAGESYCFHDSGLEVFGCSSGASFLNLPACCSARATIHSS